MASSELHHYILLERRFPSKLELKMNTPSERLAKARFYGILDLAYVGERDPLAVTHSLLDGGVDIVQLRGKNVPLERLQAVAEKIWPAIAASGALFVINDHIDLAAVVEADGVHLGQDDGTVAAARARLKPGALVGKSTHSLAQALAAQDELADYIGVGPIFATPTKPDYVPVGLDLIRQVRDAVKLPQFCIGGINAANLEQAVAAGAERIVMVSALLQAADPAAYGRAVRERLVTGSGRVF
jgi:thiamine-phosphate pyrophosphorylase